MIHNADKCTILQKWIPEKKNIVKQEGTLKVLSVDIKRLFMHVITVESESKSVTLQESNHNKDP